MSTHPAAPIVHADYACGVWSLTVTCPYCRHEHYRGGGTELSAAPLGHRWAHCLDRCAKHGKHPDNDAGYKLVDSDGLLITALAEVVER